MKNKKILIGFVILVLIIVAFFVIKDTITGLVVLTEQKTITNTLDLSFIENSTHIHKLDQYYNLKSIRLSGSIVGGGTAKIYLKKDD